MGLADFFELIEDEMRVSRLAHAAFDVAAIVQLQIDGDVPEIAI